MKDTSEAKKSTPVAKTAKKPRQITASYLENAGKFYLERFPASASHFRAVMLRKIRRSCLAHPGQNYDDCAALLDQVVEKFCELGFLDDRALTRGLLTSYRQRGWSQRRIRATMAAKGLDGELIDTQMGEQSEEESSDLIAAARFMRRKRLGPFATGEAKPDKWLGSLGRAGFDYEISRRALAMTRDEAEEILRSAD